MPAKPESYIPALFRHYGRNCRRRGIELGLSFEEFARLVESACYYCGRAPYAKWGSAPWYYTGIDRVDNDKGYEPGNVVPACRECNALKSNRLTPSETRAVARALMAHREKK